LFGPCPGGPERHGHRLPARQRHAAGRLGKELDLAASKKLQRGDLIFWKGHVAIARDANSIVHANAHHMATAIENTPRGDCAHQGRSSEILAIKRLV